MEGVKDFILIINEKLKESFTKNGIAQVLTFGLSETTISGEQSFPVFFKGNDGSWAGLDDTKNVILYHKDNAVQASSVTGYGNGNSTMVNRYGITMIIYFDAGKTGFKRDEMFTFIQAVMPEFMKGEKFSYIRTSVSNAILNTQQVFSSEYKGVPFSLKPEQSLISISYTIEGRFKKGCFNCCPEDNTTITNQ